MFTRFLAADAQGVKLRKLSSKNWHPPSKIDKVKVKFATIHVTETENFQQDYRI